MLSSTVLADIIPEVRFAVDQNNFLLGDQMIDKYRAQNGVTPEMIEAVSWLGRGALRTNKLDQAEAYAKKTHQLAIAELKKRPLDKEPHLPLALGASIEVQAQVLKARGERSEALSYLHTELAHYRGTSIRARIQKNINLIDLVGKAAPPLDEHEFLGPQPPSLAALKGKPVLLFFWAHWCGDCKLQRREISIVKSEFAAQNLIIIGPTQRYGYMAKGQDATPAEEIKYIDEVRHKYYLDLAQMPVPVSEENMRVYGVSTTPTLVLIDKLGIVRLFHPGVMTAAELSQAIRTIL